MTTDPPPPRNRSIYILLDKHVPAVPVLRYGADINMITTEPPADPPEPANDRPRRMTHRQAWQELLSFERGIRARQREDITWQQRKALFASLNRIQKLKTEVIRKLFS